MKKIIALTITIFLSGFMIVTVSAGPNDGFWHPQTGNGQKQQTKQNEKVSKLPQEKGNLSKRNQLRREQSERRKKRQEIINNAKAAEETQNRK